MTKVGWRWQDAIANVEAERDAALARAERAEQERDELKGRLSRQVDATCEHVNNLMAGKGRLAARVAELEKALTEIATHGCRHDLNPTRIIVRGSDDWLESERWWRDRAQSMDDAVRQYAREALAAGRPEEPE